MAATEVRVRLLRISCHLWAISVGRAGAEVVREVGTAMRSRADWAKIIHLHGCTGLQDVVLGLCGQSTVT
jgi:hypothetical protein